MSQRSRSDAYLGIYLDFPRDAGKAIPKPVAELMAFEADLKAFIESRGYKVRSLEFNPKEGRYIAPDME